MDNKDFKHIQSIQRAVKILSAFSNEQPELGVVEISKKTGLYKSTAHRLLKTLESEAFVRRNPETGKYRLGIKLFTLGSIAVNKLDLANHARPYLKSISKLFDETVTLVVFDYGNVICIDRIESSKQLAMRPKGMIAPPHCSGVGKAILAFLPEDELDHLIQERGLPPLTKYTITDPKVFKKHLKETRERGYAIDNEEHEYGLRCIAVPLMDYKNRVVGSISVSVPAERLNDDLYDRIVKVLLDYGTKISTELGCSELSTV